MALSLREQVLRRKPVAAMNEDSGTDSGGGELSRSIGLFQLSMFGIGATIGTGIFIVLTQAVPVAGPAVIWSFVIAGTVAGLTAICYAELASAVLAAVLPIDFLAEMTSIGTLVAFLVVSIGVMVLRRTAPDLERGFKVPGYPVTPLLSITGCIWIIQDLRAVTIWVFFGWAAVALLWYFSYGIRHSVLGQEQ